MALPERMIEWQTVDGEPVVAGDMTVTPQSQALVVRWPWGGLVWNRPVAILVQQGGQTERIPIVDVTRLVQLLLAASVALSFLLLRSRHARSS